AYQVPAPAATAATTMISTATGSASGPRRAPGCGPRACGGTDWRGPATFARRSEVRLMTGPRDGYIVRAEASRPGPDTRRHGKPANTPGSERFVPGWVTPSVVVCGQRRYARNSRQGAQHGQRVDRRQLPERLRAELRAARQV